jgi:tripartite-type tricarboxylate transporter receptor subunit TctC
MKSGFCLVLALAAAGPAQGQVGEGPYKGKQLRLVISAGTGGGYDAYARTLARHIDRHIAGNPAITLQNMPGAAGLVATNWTYNVAPKDGSVLLATYNALLPEPLFGNPAIQFDPLKFEWVGSIGKQQNICVTWHTHPVKTIEQAIGRDLTVSSTGATGFSATMGLVLNALIGTKIKVVLGYQTNEARLAVEKGEADGICGLSWSTLKASNPDWVQNSRLNILVQTGAKPHYELPKVPLLVDLVKSEADKKVVELISFSEDMGRPFVMPPGTPKEMVDAVRRGFDATMKDPAFLAEAQKAMQEVDPLTGEEMEASLKRNYAAPKELIERAARLLTAPK